MLSTDTDKIWDKGYISGAFDVFHIGHLNLIKKAKERCQSLVVGVLTDEIIAQNKKKWPVVPLKDRMEIISSIKYVDKVDVTTRELLNKVKAWQKYQFDAMFSGDDHLYDGWAREEEDLKKLGADLVFFPYTKGVSTTFLQELTLPPKAVDADKAKKIEGITYIFPFDKVNKGERIVIYGAGRVGRQYAQQLLALNFCEIVAFADTYAKPGGMFEGKHCLTPSELVENLDKFDRIVISTSIFYDQILNRLRSLGIGPERIV